MKTFKYIMLRRPFSIGCQPIDNFVSYDENIGRHGSLEYSEPLSIETLEQYELAIMADDSMIGMEQTVPFGSGELHFYVEAIEEHYKLRCLKTHSQLNKSQECIVTTNQFFLKNKKN